MVFQIGLRLSVQHRIVMAQIAPLSYITTLLTPRVTMIVLLLLLLLLFSIIFVLSIITIRLVLNH